MLSAWTCQIRKYFCLRIGGYAYHNTMPLRHFSHVPDHPTLIHKGMARLEGGGSKETK